MSLNQGRIFDSIPTIFDVFGSRSHYLRQIAQKHPPRGHFQRSERTRSRCPGGTGPGGLGSHRSDEREEGGRICLGEDVIFDG